MHGIILSNHFNLNLFISFIDRYPYTTNIKISTITLLLTISSITIKNGLGLLNITKIHTDMVTAVSWIITVSFIITEKK